MAGVSVRQRGPIDSFYVSSPLPSPPSPPSIPPPPTLPPSLPFPSIFILPTIVVIIFSTLTFKPGLGQYMAGELSQRDAIQLLFSNQTWTSLPSSAEINDLPVTSIDHQLVYNWGVPNIWVSLVLFMSVRVSGKGLFAAKWAWLISQLKHLSGWGLFCLFLKWMSHFVQLK